jgi:hypothetical protein
MLRKYAQPILRIKLPPRTLHQNNKTYGKSVRYRWVRLFPATMYLLQVLSNIDYGTYKIFQAQPETVEVANATAPNLTVVSTSVPTSLTLSKSEISKTWVFYSVITMNNDSLAISLYNKGQNLSTFQNDGTCKFSMRSNLLP